MLPRQAYLHNGSAAEWLLPVNSLDPTFQNAAVKALNSVAGTCLSPNTQPACTKVGGTTPCYNSGSNAPGTTGPDFCHRFLAPPVRTLSHQPVCQRGMC